MTGKRPSEVIAHLVSGPGRLTLKLRLGPFAVEFGRAPARRVRHGIAPTIGDLRWARRPGESDVWHLDPDAEPQTPFEQWEADHGR